MHCSRFAPDGNHDPYVVTLPLAGGLGGYTPPNFLAAETAASANVENSGYGQLIDCGRRIREKLFFINSWSDMGKAGFPLPLRERIAKARMLSSLLALAIIIFQTMLVTFITVRSRDRFASRIFIGFSIVLISMIGGVLLRDVASTPTAAYVSLGLSTVMLGGYFTLLLLLISALFVPQWWEGPMLLRRPILWISLPYVLITAAIGVDFIARIGFLVEGVYFADVYRIKYAYPASAVVILLAALGQFALLVVLGFAFFDPRHHKARPAIIVLALCIVFSLVMGALSPRLGRLVNQITQIQIFPLVGALGYLVLGTGLFSPTRAALDMALGALREAIAVTDASGAIVFANPSARRLGLQVNQPLDTYFGIHVGEVLARGNASNDDRIAFGLRTAERYLEVVIVPIRDPRDEHQAPWCSSAT